MPVARGATTGIVRTIRRVASTAAVHADPTPAAAATSAAEPPSFETLGLSDARLTRNLRRMGCWPTPTEIQALAIPPLLAGGSALWRAVRRLPRSPHDADSRGALRRSARVY